MKSGGLLLAAALIAGGCTPAPVYPLYTPLQVAGSFGYWEQRISGTRYRVTYSAPVRTTSAYGGERRNRDAEHQVGLAYDLALWRAADLALANGYPAFKVAQRSNDVQVDVRYDPDPFVGFGHHDHHGHFPHRYRYPYPRYAELAAAVTLAVEFRRAGDADTLDARAARRRLRARYSEATAPGSAGY